MFKNSKILSALRFHIKTITNKEEALDELEENKDIIFFLPVVTSLAMIVLSLLLTPLSLVALGITIFVISISFMFYHLIIATIFSNLLSQRNLKREREEEIIAEGLRREKIRKREEIRRKEWERIYEHIRREQFEQQERERKAKEQFNKYNERNDYYNQSNNRENTVDQNLVNAIKLMGLQNNFTQKDVKSAYRKLSKIHHPDMGGSEVNFKKLNTAYNYVMDRI